MTDTQLLLCVVLIFYLIGRCRWRPESSVAFRSILFSPYRTVTGESPIGNRRGSIVFSDPFVPLRPLYFADASDPVFSPAGVAIRTLNRLSAMRPAFEFIRYEDIRLVEQKDNVVILNGNVRAKCRTPTLARTFVSQMTQLRNQNAEQREHELRGMVRSAFDIRAARGQCRRSSRLLRSLQITANTWLVAITSVYLLTTSRFGQAGATLPLLFALEIAAIHLSFVFYHTHRRQFPEERRERISEVMRFIFCPPTVFGCVNAITANLFSGFAPVVVACVVCDRAEFEQFSYRAVRSLKFSRLSIEDPVQRESLDWMRSTTDKCLTEFLVTAGVHIPDCLEAPAPAGVEDKSYCPLCRTQYRFTEGVCPDCGIEVCATFESII